MKKFFAVLLAVCMLTFVGCGNDSGVKKTDSEKLVGVAMPNTVVKRWFKDGDKIKTSLEAKGYKVDLQYADNNPETQIQQLTDMIESGADCLVITAIDSTKLVDILAKAKEKNIPVIAYDRLLMDTDSVSYYATFDNKGVGILIGRYVEEKLNLRNSDKTYNVEFFAGSADDNNAHFLNEGVFEVLQPYIDNGKLKVPSDGTDFNAISILRWSQEGAQKRMSDILKIYYKDKKIDAVISPSDKMDYGIINALEDAGYKVGEDFPIITGQDAELQAIKNIWSGTQTMTVFKDTRILAEKCVTMVEAVLEGKAPEINDTISYDNRKMVVPAYLCKPMIIDKDNIHKEIIESGYYTKEELDS